MGVRSGGAGVGGNSGSVGSESISVGVVETVISVEGFGFSGPLGPGESPDGLADVAGSTVGVGGESLFGFFSGSFADTLKRYSTCKYSLSLNLRLLIRNRYSLEFDV